jgi:phospholipase/lecithinase/hemolysin
VTESLAFGFLGEKRPTERSMAWARKPLAAALAVALLLGLCRGDVVQFIFGDSLSDVGNNNYLKKSLARAALPWYGIDFGRGMPNGRFCNGRTVADIVGDKMGLPRPPAFLDPSLDADTIFKYGVNYASGGGGILNETSSLFVSCSYLLLATY